MKRTILVVDDDIDFIEQQKLFLEGEGHKVVSAETSEDARELLESERPDLAIIDMMMEQPDAGAFLAHHMKKVRPEMPVIMVTAVISETGMDFEAASKGERSWIKADVVLAKPIRFEQVRREMKRLLGD